jgi:soluble lytic murein transglycosylase-like protein
VTWANKCGGKRWRTLRDGRIEVEGEGVPLVRPGTARFKQLERNWRNWSSLLSSAAARYKLPLSWLVALATVETGSWSDRPSVQASIRSPAGAVGIMQIMPQYQPESAAQLTDPRTNTNVAARIVRDLVDGRTGPELPHIASAYNAGAGSTSLGVRCAPSRNEWALMADANYPRQALELNNSAITYLKLGRVSLASVATGSILAAAVLGAVWWWRQRRQ